MVVCVCRRVAESTIHEVIGHGARSVEEIGQRCGAGTDCGSCQDDLQDMLSALRSPAPSVRIRLSRTPHFGWMRSAAPLALASSAVKTRTSESVLGHGR